jgi:fructokinase
MPGKIKAGMLDPLPLLLHAVMAPLNPNESCVMFVVCGEALMDVFAAGTTAAGMTLDARVGGSPFNAAVGLARLAQPVAFFSAVSRDFLGERLVHALAAEGVDTSTVQRINAPTTLGLVGVDAQGVPSYSFYGQGCADRLLAIDALATLPQDMRAIHLGSFATVVEPTASTLRALVEREHGRTLIAYDPNIRLNVEPDLARWRDMLQWMLTRTHLLKISEEDLQLLLPGATPEEFARQALGRGVKLAVVTRGSEGVVACTPNACAIVPTVPVEVIDTVGAGDTFQAALLTWLAEHSALSVPALAALSSADLESALGFAARAAAITCSRRGADMPRRSELD